MKSVFIFPFDWRLLIPCPITMLHLAKRRSLGLLCGDPVVDALVEDAQRQGTVPNDLVVEGAEVELVTELGCRSGA